MLQGKLVLPMDLLPQDKINKMAEVLTQFTCFTES
jgi:hypothetical protein